MTEMTVPVPVDDVVVMRSALFALSKLDAELHQYSEQEGLAIASVYRFGGLRKQRVEISVERHDATSLVKITAAKPDELLTLISYYIIKGSKAIKDDASAQWDDLIIAEESKQQSVWTALKDKIADFTSEREKTPDDAETPDAQEEIAASTVLASQAPEAMAKIDQQGVIVLEPEAMPLQVPEDPGPLVRVRGGDLVEVKVDPDISYDRGQYLRMCQHCNAPLLQGSYYCSNCGQVLELKEVQKREIKAKVKRYANAALRYGLLGLTPYIFVLTWMTVAAIIVVSASPSVVTPYAANAGLEVLETATAANTGEATSWMGFLSNAQAVVGEVAKNMTDLLSRGLTMLTTLFLLLIVLPAFLLGRKAISKAQGARIHMDLNFNTEKAGKKRVAIATAIGWFLTYVSIMIVLALLFLGRLM